MKSKTITKRMINTVTAGRTGTTYVTKLFALLPGVTSLHEPEPNYKIAMRRAQDNPQIAMKFIVEYKAPFVNALVSPIYIETSHLFCKGFFEPLCMLGECPDLMLITRSPQPIAVSLLRKATVPERTHLGRRYLLSPADPNVLRLRGWEKMTDYQLCYWYALEIERRQEKYGRMAAKLGRIVLTFSADELNDFERFKQVGIDLGLDTTSERLKEEHRVISEKKHNVPHTPMNSEALPSRQELRAQEEQVLNEIAWHEPVLAARHLQELAGWDPYTQRGTDETMNG